MCGFETLDVLFMCNFQAMVQFFFCLFFLIHCTIFAFHTSVQNNSLNLSLHFSFLSFAFFFPPQCRDRIQSKSRADSQFPLRLCVSFFMFIQPNWHSWRDFESQNSMWELNSHYANLYMPFDGLGYSSWCNDDYLF